MGEADCKMSDNGSKIASPETKIKRRKSVRKKKTTVVSPLKKLLRESQTWTASELELFSNLPTSQERVEFVYQILPHDATSLDRLWPIQIVQKDSMIRRQLSDKGKECFLNGEWDKVLDFYNEAALFSTCKGLGHTMARRAAYLLQTGDIDLALRDIKVAFDLGCLERELMDFLLAHHTTDAEMRASRNDASVERSIEAMYNPDITNEHKKYFGDKLRSDLEHIRTQKKGRPTEEDVNNIINQLKAEAEKQQADKSSGLKRPMPKIRPPQIEARNARYPSFSDAVSVVVDMDKGRKVVAERKIPIGDIIMTETPNTLFFCPEMEKLPLLKSHCLHCMSYSIAPIPCNECCVVCFCSEECQEAASYHVYECRMKLYEMLHFMGDEYASVFMAIRTITQKPARYFWERRDTILEILTMDYPEMREPSEVWNSDAIEPLLRLMSHQDEIEPEVLMKNAVISVFFLRALQAVNYFQDVMPRKSKTDPRLKEPEALILYILNHLINTQSHNSTPFMRLVEIADASNVCIKQDVGRRYFRWEYMGSSISSSLALINHSCDPNCIQFHVGRYAVLVPMRRIAQGEEITIAYDKLHHEDQPLMQRQLHCLRKFYFSCECPPCANDWTTYPDMPDTLYLVPNFETEKHFVVRIGDKRDLVRSIEMLKLKAEKEFREGSLDASMETMNQLSELLEDEIAKPHQYHIEANHVAMLCVMTKLLKDVAKIVERTNFNKQFPPTYVNGEFVYSEKPISAEESRYWEYGFMEQPKPKKRKSLKKSKKIESDNGKQANPPQPANGVVENPALMAVSEQNVPSENENPPNNIEVGATSKIKPISNSPDPTVEPIQESFELVEPQDKSDDIPDIQPNGDITEPIVTSEDAIQESIQIDDKVQPKDKSGEIPDIQRNGDISEFLVNHEESIEANDNVPPEEETSVQIPDIQPTEPVVTNVVAIQKSLEVDDTVQARDKSEIPKSDITESILIYEGPIQESVSTSDKVMVMEESTEVSNGQPKSDITESILNQEVVIEELVVPDAPIILVLPNSEVTEKMGKNEAVSQDPRVPIDTNDIRVECQATDPNGTHEIDSQSSTGTNDKVESDTKSDDINNVTEPTLKNEDAIQEPQGTDSQVETLAIGNIRAHHNIAGTNVMGVHLSNGTNEKSNESPTEISDSPANIAFAEPALKNEGVIKGTGNHDVKINKDIIEIGPKSDLSETTGTNETDLQPSIGKNVKVEWNRKSSEILSVQSQNKIIGPCITSQSIGTNFRDEPKNAAAEISKVLLNSVMSEPSLKNEDSIHSKLKGTESQVEKNEIGTPDIRPDDTRPMSKGIHKIGIQQSNGTDEKVDINKKSIEIAKVLLSSGICGSGNNQEKNMQNNGIVISNTETTRLHHNLALSEGKEQAFVADQDNLGIVESMDSVVIPEESQLRKANKSGELNSLKKTEVTQEPGIEPNTQSSVVLPTLKDPPQTPVPVLLLSQANPESLQGDPMIPKSDSVETFLDNVPPVLQEGLQEIPTHLGSPGTEETPKEAIESQVVLTYFIDSKAEGITKENAPTVIQTHKLPANAVLVQPKVKIPPPPKRERIPPPPTLERIKPPPVDEDLMKLCMLQIQNQGKSKDEMDHDPNLVRSESKSRQERWL